jgi:hypothetical protein
MCDFNPSQIITGYQLFSTHVDQLWKQQFPDEHIRQRQINIEWTQMGTFQQSEWLRCVGGVAVPRWLPRNLISSRDPTSPFGVNSHELTPNMMVQTKPYFLRNMTKPSINHIHDTQVNHEVENYSVPCYTPMSKPFVSEPPQSQRANIHINKQQVMNTCDFNELCDLDNIDNTHHFMCHLDDT